MQLKGDENGLINLSIGVVVAIISMVEVVGRVLNGDSLLVAQVWAGPTGGGLT